MDRGGDREVEAQHRGQVVGCQAAGRKGNEEPKFPQGGIQKAEGNGRAQEAADGDRVLGLEEPKRGGDRKRLGHFDNS